MNQPISNGKFRWSDLDVQAADEVSLTRTPSIVREVVADRPPEWLDSRHGGDSLSPREVLGHFIHCEKENWIPRVRLILESDVARCFEPFDVYGGNQLSHELSVTDLVDEFARLRQNSLDELYGFGITELDLGKTAIHPKLGPVTLDQLIATWVSHDLYHLGQIFKSFSAPFQPWIGPWQEILNLPHFN